MAPRKPNPKPERPPSELFRDRDSDEDDGIQSHPRAMIGMLQRGRIEALRKPAVGTPTAHNAEHELDVRSMNPPLTTLEPPSPTFSDSGIVVVSRPASEIIAASDVDTRLGKKILASLPESATFIANQSERITHKVAEQGRRNRINSALIEIEALLPKSIVSRKDNENEYRRKSQENLAVIPSDSKRSKVGVLEDAIAYIKSLQTELEIRKPESNRGFEEDQIKSQISPADQSVHVGGTTALSEHDELAQALELSLLEMVKQESINLIHESSDESSPSEHHYVSSDHIKSKKSVGFTLPDANLNLEPQESQIKDSADDEKSVETIPVTEDLRGHDDDANLKYFSGSATASTTSFNRSELAVTMCYDAAQTIAAAYHIYSRFRIIDRIVLMTLREVVYDFCLLRESLTKKTLDEAEFRTPKMFDMILELLVDFAETLKSGFASIDVFKGDEESKAARVSFRKAFRKLESTLVANVAGTLRRNGPDWGELFPESLADGRESKSLLKFDTSIEETVNLLQHTTKLLMSFLPSFENLTPSTSASETSPPTAIE